MNTKHTTGNQRERERREDTERILKRRDKEKLLEELAELENDEASCWSKIFSSTLSLLIIEPTIVAGTVYYFWSEIKRASSGGMQIANLGSNLRWAAIGFAISFTLTSLTLIYYLWQVSSLKKRIAKVRWKISLL